MNKARAINKCFPLAHTIKMPPVIKMLKIVPEKAFLPAPAFFGTTGMASWHQQQIKELEKMKQKRKLEEESVENQSHKKKRTDGQLSYLLVYYDLEMCQGSVAGEIFQLGAKTAMGSEFCRHILPRGDIEWGVTRYFNGIKIQRDHNGRRQLVNKKRTFETVDSNDAFKHFLAWIKEQKECGKFEKVVLIAHGDGDMPVLLNNLARDNLINDLKLSVDYFADSLRYFQHNFKAWDKYKLALIYKRIFPKREAFAAHDALADAKALRDIIEKIGKENQDDLINKVLKHSFDVEKGCEVAKRKIQKTLHKSATNKNAHSDPRCLKFCKL